MSDPVKDLAAELMEEAKPYLEVSEETISLVNESLDMYRAHLRAQVVALPQTWVLDEDAPEPIFVKAVRVRDALALIGGNPDA